jgi:hypothetical protein
MSHPDIDFGSTNPDQVKHYTGIFKGVTLEDLKQNRIKARHALLVKLTCAGHSAVAWDYWTARDVKQKHQRQYLSNFDRKHSEYIFQVPKAEQYAIDKTLAETGWQL